MNKYTEKKCRECGNMFPTRDTMSRNFCSVECEYLWNKKNGKYKSGRGPSWEYVCRMLTTKNRTGDAYGITIPKLLVEKYNLLGKKFKVDIKKKGVFIIRTKIEYQEIK